MFQIERIASYLYLIPVVILSSGFFQVIEQWLIRMKQFGITARVQLLQASILQGTIALVGFIHPFVSVLIILSALREGLKALMMFGFIKISRYKKPIELHEEESSMKKVAKAHRDFPFFRAPEMFLSAVSHGVPILLLTVFFGPASAGFYSICKIVLEIPSQLIGKAVGDVFYPRIAKAANNDEKLTPLMKKATKFLGIVGIIPFIIVIIFGPWLFSFVFGEEWVMAGKYARWIALWSFFAFINKPSVRALPILSAQAFHLGFTIITLIVRIAVLVIGYYLFSNDLIVIALLGMTGALLNFFLILATKHISKNYDQPYDYN